jgi:hypothetical protein
VAARRRPSLTYGVAAHRKPMFPVVESHEFELRADTR